jgi:hypothetical protein
VSHQASFLERVWADREEVVYPRLFGPLVPSIAPLPAELFHSMFGQESVDPRWLHVGVMTAPPAGPRGSWLYVTSGLSNPWEDVGPRLGPGPSGLGREFVLETTEAADWAIIRLQHVAAFELLLAAGRYPGHAALGVHDRLPLRGPITLGGDSPLRWLLVTAEADCAPTITMESGQVDLLTLVGITDDEAAFARVHGGDELVSLLRAGGAFPVSDPQRPSVLPAS